MVINYNLFETCSSGLYKEVVVLIKGGQILLALVKTCEYKIITTNHNIIVLTIVSGEGFNIPCMIDIRSCLFVN